MFWTGSSLDFALRRVFDNDICLLVFAMLLGISFISMASSMGFRAGGMTAGDAFGKFFPFARKPGPGKKAIRVKKGKELVVSVAVAAAGGGNAGSKMAGDAAKKKTGEAAAKKKPADNAKKKAEDKAKKAYEEKRKRAMMEETGKTGGKKPGERKTAAFIAGKDEEDRKFVEKKKTFSDMQEEKDRPEVKKLVYLDGVKSRLSDEELRLLRDEPNVAMRNLKLALRGDNAREGDIIQSLGGAKGKENAEMFFRENGFETKSEIKHGGPEGRKIDVVAFANRGTTLNYRTINDNGHVIAKSEVVEKTTIAGIEAKSLAASSLETEPCVNTIECQVRDAARSGKFDRVYVYVTNDIMQLPEEKRAEIADRVRKAGEVKTEEGVVCKAEIIISDSSTEDNRKTGRRIIEKLKEEANK